MFCCLSLLGFLWSGAALRASDSEKLEPPDWPMRLRAVCSIATGWRWRMMRDEPRKTNTALCFGTENVMEEKEEEIVLGSLVLGSGSKQSFFLFITISSSLSPWYTDDHCCLYLCFREGKYIPLPQRAREREMGVSGRGERGGAVSTLPNRANRPGPSSSSPRPLPSGSGQTLPPADRSSPLSVRGGYSAHQSQSSSPTQPRPSEPGHSSPPSPHTLPHSVSHPQSLSDSARPVNGGKLCVLCVRELSFLMFVMVAALCFNEHCINLL